MKQVPVGLTAAVLLCIAIAPQREVLAKTSLCTVCPVPGVKSTAAEALNPASKGACSTSKAKNGYTLPDPKCTPGAFNPTVPPTVFGAKKFTTKCVRDCLTSSGQKNTMYTRYKVKRNPSCELDHLIPLEMGGADSLDNIWPQCGQAPNGKNYNDIKDQVEQYLSIKVLQGMDISEARKGIASDWTQYIADAEAFCAKQSCSIDNYRK